MVSLKKLAGVSAPRIPYKIISDEIVGVNFDLSIVFVDEDESRRLNFEYRKVDSPTNILSFPLDESSGELVFNTKLSTREAKALKIDLRSYLTYLFIHGLLHLKGHDHGPKMTKEETTLVKKHCKKDTDLIAENFL